MSGLPIELYHNIIRYLSDDHKALKACSLVCQILTSESQKYLFSRIVLGLPASPDDLRLQLTQFKRYQRLCGMPGVGSATRFRQLLDTSPHLADHVECLQIIEMESTDLKDRKAWIEENQDLPQCLTYFHKVKALVICGFRDWTFVPFCSELVRLLSLPSLIFLDLAGCLLPIPVLGALSPDLKHLSIRTYTYKNFQLPILPNTTPIRLQSLFVANVGCLRRQEFGRRFDTTRLRKLALNMAWITCSDRNLEIRDFLATCCNTLEDLMIFSVRDLVWQNVSSSIDQYEEPIDLSRLPALRSLTLGIDLGKAHSGPEEEFYINHFWWFNKLLRACSSDNKRLEKITVEIAYDFRMASIDLLHWDEVVDALLGHHFASLKRFDILIVPPTRTEEAEQVVIMLLKSSYIKRLQSRQPDGLAVNVVDMTCLPAPCIFTPDPNWLCVADAGEWF